MDLSSVPMAPRLAAIISQVAVATGNAGGNGTAFGIQGDIIPGAGSNKVTEPDTTVFKGKKARCLRPDQIRQRVQLLAHQIPAMTRI